MPGYRTHIVGGLAFGAATLALTGAWQQNSAPSNLEYLSCAVIGALFPDIDINSKGQKLFYFVLAIVLLLLLWLHKTAWFLAASLIGMIPLILRHRGLMHHPWFISCCAGIPAFYWYANKHPYRSFSIDLFYFAIGAFSHVILDIGFVNFCRKAFLFR